MHVKFVACWFWQALSVLNVQIKSIHQTTKCSKCIFLADKHVEPYNDGHVENHITVNHVNEDHLPEELTNHVDRPKDPMRESIEQETLDNGTLLPPEPSFVNNNMNKKALGVAKEHNKQLRELIVREVKRPGKSKCNFDSVMDDLRNRDWEGGGPMSHYF